MGSLGDGKTGKKGTIVWLCGERGHADDTVTYMSSIRKINKKSTYASWILWDLSGDNLKFISLRQ